MEVKIKTLKQWKLKSNPKTMKIRLLLCFEFNLVRWNGQPFFALIYHPTKSPYYITIEKLQDVIFQSKRFQLFITCGPHLRNF